MVMLRCCARAATRTLSVRTLSTSAVARKDFVQELYLRELKAFKPSAQAKDAHVGQVKEFHSPAAPNKPDGLSASDLAKELEAYDRSSPADVSASSSTATEPEADEHRETADDFLESLRAPPAPEVVHH